MTKYLRFALALVCLLFAGALYAQFPGLRQGVLRLHSLPTRSWWRRAKGHCHVDQPGHRHQGATSTDENGNFDFFNVKVGRYNLVVEHTGFSKATASDVVVNVGARQRVDFAMQVGAVTETVEVSGTATALQTDSSEHGQVINSQAVVELPLLNAARNYSDLALLATNVHRSPLAANAVTPREGAFNVNGMRSTYNNFLLDGQDK